MLVLLVNTFSSHPLEVEVDNEYVNDIIVLFFIGNMCCAYNRYWKTVHGLVLGVGLLLLAGILLMTSDLAGGWLCSRQL